MKLIVSGQWRLEDRAVSVSGRGRSSPIIFTTLGMAATVPAKIFLKFEGVYFDRDYLAQLKLLMMLMLLLLLLLVLL